MTTGEISPTAFREESFEGGYPFTRALEIMEAILVTIGVTAKSDMVKVWDHVLSSGGLQELHHSIQQPESFLHLIRLFGSLAGKTEQAEELAGYIENILSIIKDGLTRTEYRPQVYYAMGKPLFCLNAGRMENQLVEYAGGFSVNKLVHGSGRPGTGIPAATLNALNPQFIFISAFLSSPPEDFYEDCLAAGICADAVWDRKIFGHPVPASDFGSPRWVLGLMHIANVLHPEIFHFDVIAEANEFYRRFYHTDFCLTDINRSFSKPSAKWKSVTEKNKRTIYNIN